VARLAEVWFFTGTGELLMKDYVLNRAISLEAVGISPLRRFVKNWLARRAITKLHRLDDYLLSDIGVTREEVQWAQGLPLTCNAALALEERGFRRRKNVTVERWPAGEAN
jgi:uncharacterized protein YjiS (DUF1127 family)